MIKILSAEIPVEFLCSYFSIGRSSYYSWDKGDFCSRLKTKKSVCHEIRILFEESRGTYGSPRIHRSLAGRGYQVSENTVAKYMREMGLDARLKKKYRVQTTDSNHTHPIAPRVFKTEDGDLPDLPGKLLAGDITYLKVGGKFIYLAVVLDLFNREVVGWSMGESLGTDLVLRAMDSAMKDVGQSAEMIFHSDRGSQYASKAYRNFLEGKDIIPSMSRKGNCYDNAFVESWFATLKKEWIYRCQYSTKEELRSLVFEYIEVWYNRKRRHSSLGFLSPKEYKQSVETA